MAKVPGLRWNEGKRYFFVRWQDRDTGSRREKTFGRDKGEAQRQYEDWRREFTQSVYSSQPARPVLSASIDELVLNYLESIRDRYKRKSYVDYQRAGALLREIFGRLAVAAFRIPQFRQLIDRMITMGWALRTIDVRIGVVKAIFKYAMDCDLITGEQYFLIKGVGCVRSDDARVKVPLKIPPVPVDVVDRTLPYLTPMVADIVRVQLLAGMRAGEVCRMRFDELAWDADGMLWYRPAKHKTSRHGVRREISLGPKSQAVLATYGVTPGLATAKREYVFDPRDVDRRRSALKKTRKTGTLAYFETERYTHEIRDGVNLAIAAGAITESERWTSHQLRHRALTDTRRDYGLDAAQMMGGHTDAKTTQRYAAPDRSKLARVAMERG